MPRRRLATSVRLIGSSVLRARASQMTGGSIFLATGAEAWLDRCVLDAGERTLIQSQDRGLVMVRESLLRGEGMGLFRVGRGVLAGVVIDVARDPLGRVPQSLAGRGLRISPSLFHLVRDGQEVPAALQLSREPLSRRSTGR